MRENYEQRNDYQFGQRVLIAAIIACIPVWVGLGLAFALDWRLAGYFISLACSLPIAFLIIYFSSRVAKCPKCGRPVRINWRSRDFCHGGMLRYICENCRIEWATHLYPGSDL
jgi:hypothetical protein